MIGAITIFVSGCDRVPHVAIFAYVSIICSHDLYNSGNGYVFYQLPLIQTASKLRKIVIYIQDLDKHLRKEQILTLEPTIDLKIKASEI